MADDATTHQDMPSAWCPWEGLAFPARVVTTQDLWPPLTPPSFLKCLELEPPPKAAAAEGERGEGTGGESPAEGARLVFSFPPISREELQAEMKLFTRGELIHQLQEPRPGGAPIRESESVTDLGTPEQRRPGDPQAEHSWGASPSPAGDLLMTHRVGAGNWDLSRVESDPAAHSPAAWERRP